MRSRRSASRSLRFHPCSPFFLSLSHSFIPYQRNEAGQETDRQRERERGVGKPSRCVSLDDDLYAEDPRKLRPTLVAITQHSDPIVNLVRCRRARQCIRSAGTALFPSLCPSFPPVLYLCYCFDGEIIAGRRDAIIKRGSRYRAGPSALRKIFIRGETASALFIPRAPVRC